MILAIGSFLIKTLLSKFYHRSRIGMSGALQHRVPPSVVDPLRRAQWQAGPASWRQKNVGHFLSERRIRRGCPCVFSCCSRSNGSRNIMLGHCRRLMPEPCLQFKQGHRLTHVKQLAGNCGTCPVTADRATSIFTRNSCSPA